MKKLMTLLFIGFVTFSINGQEQTVTETKVDPNAPVMEFETEVIDYGKIEQNADGVRVFKFKNTGKSPLIISRIQSSCGCTVPKKPEDPIMPGKDGEIEVKYAGFIQRQLAEVERFKNLEKIKVPPDLDYASIASLSREIREKLAVFKPLNLGQASRISGVTPVAISILMIYLRKFARP